MPFEAHSTGVFDIDLAVGLLLLLLVSHLLRLQTAFLKSHVIHSANGELDR